MSPAHPVGGSPMNSPMPQRVAESATRWRPLQEAMLDWRHEVSRETSALGRWRCHGRSVAGLLWLTVGLSAVELAATLWSPWFPMWIAWLAVMAVWNHVPVGTPQWPTEAIAIAETRNWMSAALFQIPSAVFATLVVASPRWRSPVPAFLCVGAVAGVVTGRWAFPMLDAAFVGAAGGVISFSSDYARPMPWWYLSLAFAQICFCAVCGDWIRRDTARWRLVAGVLVFVATCQLTLHTVDIVLFAAKTGFLKGDEVYLPMGALNLLWWAQFNGLTAPLGSMLMLAGLTWRRRNRLNDQGAKGGFSAGMA